MKSYLYTNLLPERMIAMNKQEFLAKLRIELSAFPQNDAEECLLFYSEMIDDRIEEGLSEEQAVLAVGTIDEIVLQMASEIPPEKMASIKAKPKRHLSIGEIILLTLGSPIWLSLAIAAFAVILSIYICIWAVIFSLWSIFVSLAACSVGGVLSCFVFTAEGKVASGLAMFAAGIVCAGLSIFMFYGCKAATKGTLILTKKATIWIKSRLTKKEASK